MSYNESETDLESLAFLDEVYRTDKDYKKDKTEVHTVKAAKDDLMALELPFMGAGKADELKKDLSKHKPEKIVRKAHDIAEVYMHGHEVSGNQQLFLRAYFKTKNLSKALAMSGVSKTTYNKWLSDSTHFSAVVGSVMDVIADALEETALALALEGNEKVLMKMLEAYRPEKFSPKKAIDFNANINSTVNVKDWAELAKTATLDFSEYKILADEREDGAGDEMSKLSKPSLNI